MDHTGRPGGLRLFDMVLVSLGLVLAAITVAAIPLLALFLTGRGPITVLGQVKPPYSIGFPDDRVVVIADEGHVSARVNFAAGEEARHFKEPPRVLASVRLDPEDTDSRAVLSATIVAFVALAWVGLIKLRGVVRSALRGDPFVPANVARLRWLAACVLTLPVVAWLGTRMLNHTLDVDPTVTVLSRGPSGWTVLVVGFGLLALAEVFGKGSDLRQFESETV